ncbi:hypothetical protein HELRODRAFT_175779 [Helobdella robusta]|uniref:Endonuclease/exonuclease/phosphatase domain-containing protein n=1 Tax=Helobdella robusta TaxID=6412 RepID=T1F9N2_HELRO|nr:hypothetical protein HELRODRAFT_175779 [Helobdella robusta]ESO00369.1 hypothetical protein HELRODRAFT_175779 [Helobdella robusta]
MLKIMGAEKRTVEFKISIIGFAEVNKRGLVLYYKNSIVVSEVAMKSDFKEHISVKLVMSKSILNIVFIYRSPKSDEKNNKNLLSLLIEGLSLNGDFLMLGDFNFPEIDWETFSCRGSDEKIENEFLSILKDKFLIQHINFPTRFRDGQAANILDLVISAKELVRDIMHHPPLGNSDHSIVEFKVIGFRCPPEKYKKKYYDSGNYESFRELLSQELDNRTEQYYNLRLNHYNSTINVELRRLEKRQNLCKLILFSGL